MGNKIRLSICLLLLSVSLYGQFRTDSQMIQSADTIRNETVPGGNTRQRISNNFKYLINSKVTTARTITINGTTFDLSANRSWTTNIYNGTSPTTVTVGGLTSGTAISGLSYQAILQAIVAPYVNPVFTSFSVSGQATTIEVGTTLSGSKTFTWGITLNSGVVPTIDIYDNTAASTLLAGTANDGTQSQTITTIQLNSNGATQSWKGVGNNTSPSGTFNSSNFVVTARFYRFYGADATPTNSAEVRALPLSSFHSGASSFTFTTGASATNFVVALPPGVTISSVIDLTNLNVDITSNFVLEPSTVDVLDAGSTNRAYNIYVYSIGSPYSSSATLQVTTNN